MTTDGIPPMKPLAPIVDKMRKLAREELPSPRTCKIRLWDDGTFDVVIYHSRGEDERESLRYERTTGEVLWEHARGIGWRSESLTGGESVHEPVVEEADVRVVARLDPPYR
jgi:hypothetical protein